MTDMTRETATIVAKALNDIEDFELLMDGITAVYHHTEGDFEDFFETKIMPLMNAELARRKSILTAI